MLKSLCQRCVFAEFDADNVQTGCKADRLELFVKNGVEVSRAFEHEPETPWERSPGGREYAVVHGRVCKYCRAEDSPWAAEVPPEKWLETAREEATTRIAVVVFVPHGAAVEEVLDTAEAIEAQELPFAVAQFVLVSNSPSSMRVISALRKREMKTPWNVKVVTERDNGRPVGRGRAIDMGVGDLSFADCAFYLAVDAGAMPWAGLTTDVDGALNDRLDQFLVLRPVVQQESGHPDRVIGPLVQLKIHAGVHGNEPAENERPDGSVLRLDTVEDKVALMAADDGSDRLVKGLAEVSAPPC